MKKTITVEIELTEIIVDKRIERVVDSLRKRHPELANILVSSGKLTTVGKVLVFNEFSREGEQKYFTAIQQGGLGVTW